MSDNKLTPQELEILRVAGRDAYFVNAQVENANRKIEAAYRVLKKAKESQAKAVRERKKAFYWACLTAIFLVLSVVMG